MRDFNVHVDCSVGNSVKLIGLLDQYEKSPLLACVIQGMSYIPDTYRIVTCLLEMRRPGKNKEERVFHAFQKISISDFKEDL